MARDALRAPPPAAPPAAAPAGEVGSFVGRYRLVAELGVGGMASVHLARADGPGGFQKWVAIKRIHPHLAEDQSFIDMFLDEARIAARISHPNVAQVFDLGRAKGTYFLALEYLHGEPLREVLRAVEDGAPRPSPVLAARVIADAADGLHAAHELRDERGEWLGLVHRDVTPHNLFITFDGAVKVVDFGVAKAARRLSETQVGTLKGKVAYMSPEQARGEEVDRRTDVFALGVVLWELTTGKRLFRAETDLETVQRVQACQVPPPSSVVRGYPPELEHIVLKALDADPARRFPTARDLSRALQQFIVQSGQLVGQEEVGEYARRVLDDRFERRQADLHRAEEATSTLALDDLEEYTGSQFSLLTEVDSPAPPVNPPSAPSASGPMARPPVPPPGAPPAPPARAPRQPTLMGMPRGPLPPPTPAPPVSRPLPAPTPPPRSVPPPAAPRGPLARTQLGMGAAPAGGAAAGAYGDEDDEDAVTRVVQSPYEQPRGPASATPFTAAAALLQAPPSAAPMSRPAPMPASAPTPAPVSAAPPIPAPQAAAPAPLPMPAFVPPPAPPPANKALVAVTAAASTLIALALIALVYMRISERGQPSATVSIGPNPTATAPAAAPAPTPTPTPAATATPTATAAAPAPAPTPAAPAAMDVGSLPTSADAKPTATAAAPAPRTGDPAPARTADPAPRPAAPPATTAAAAAPPAATPEPPASTAPGFLTIVCDPACDAVLVDGKNLGPSPVVRYSLSPGSHSVVLRKAGVAPKGMGVKIVSGQTSAQRVKMGE